MTGSLRGVCSHSAGHHRQRRLLLYCHAGEISLAKGDVNPAELREIVADIEADGHRAAEVIRAIRNMVRKVDGKRAMVDVNAVIHDAVRLALPDAQARRCELSTNLQTELPTVLGDAVQLQQVLLNLVINAFDAMQASPREQHRVEIVSRRIETHTV
jgi:two-component system sensor kinase FixL